MRILAHIVAELSLCTKQNEIKKKTSEKKIFGKKNRQTGENYATQMLNKSKPKAFACVLALATPQSSLALPTDLDYIIRSR